MTTAMTASTSAQPFSGVRIVDLTRVLAGPFASQQLALLGAEVIKIEPKEGEDLRATGRTPGWENRDATPAFLAVNANKRSITLDLKHPLGVAVVERLVTDADVIMENFRPGVMDKLGLGWERLQQLNPRLIYASISGFGHTGPLRTAAAFDGMIQAMSGLMSITGHEELGPTRAGFAACDVISGMNGAFAVASALYQRTHTGRGQRVDVSMLDATLNALRMQVVENLVAGVVHGQAGNLSVSKKPTADMFPTKQGHLVLAILTEGQFARLLDVVGRPEIAKDPRFRDWPSRIDNGAALRALLIDALACDTAESWAARLHAADAPCARVWSIDEITKHPQLASRSLIQTVDSPWGALKLLGTGFELEHGGARIDSPPPRLGEHTEEVLLAAGFDTATIADMRAKGVV